MTVSEAVTKSGITPNAEYTGVETANDFIFAVCTDSESQTSEKAWIVCADHVSEHSSALNASTEDTEYIRTGRVTDKTSVSRQLSVSGHRCVGDAFQDWLLSHKIKYGTGDDVKVPYLYFSLRTGKGDKGECNLVVTADASGAAGAKAGFAATAYCIGTPEEFDYSTIAAG